MPSVVRIKRSPGPIGVITACRGGSRYPTTPGRRKIVSTFGSTDALVRNPGVNVVLFTGSYDVGKRIQQLSADHFDRIVAAEMGSKAAVIVCADARLDLAVTSALISGFKTSGQRCVSAGRILVAEKIFDKFAQQFVATAKRLRIGSPLDAGNFTGPVIHTASAEKIQYYIDLARTEGATVLLEGGPHLAGAFLDAGEIDEIRLFLAPLLLGGSAARDPLEGKGVERISEALRALTFSCQSVGEDLLISARLREW